MSNATNLVRALRGRGLVISSEAKKALAVRGPWDVVNLATVWGVSQERGKEAVSREAHSVVMQAGLKRSSYKGVVDVIYGGDKPPLMTTTTKQKAGENAVQKHGKRKAEALETEGRGKVGDVQDKPISKREAKRRAKMAKRDAETGEVVGGNDVHTTASQGDTSRSNGKQSIPIHSGNP